MQGEDPKIVWMDGRMKNGARNRDGWSKSTEREFCKIHGRIEHHSDRNGRVILISSDQCAEVYSEWVLRGEIDQDDLAILKVDIQLKAKDRDGMYLFIFFQTYCRAEAVNLFSLTYSHSSKYFPRPMILKKISGAF